MKVSCDGALKVTDKDLTGNYFYISPFRSNSDVLGYNTIIASKRRDVQLVADMPHINLQSSCR